MSYLPKNKWHFELYNRNTFRQTMRRINFDAERNPEVSAVEPVWVTGMFRSGTSIITRILQAIGGNLGPDDHLLQAKGARAVLNPEGFHENYLFMDLSLYLFEQLNAWGDRPPKHAEVEDLDLDDFDHDDFCQYSIVKVHDDRISNVNKRKVLQDYGWANIDEYVANQFKGVPVIKNPHFALLTPVLDRIWPNGKYLVVVRHPGAVLRSALRVTPRADALLYEAYYQALLSHPNAIIVSHEGLLQHPESSVKAMANALGLQGDNVAKAAQLVQQIQAKQLSDADLPESTLDLYQALIAKAINPS